MISECGETIFYDFVCGYGLVKKKKENENICIFVWFLSLFFSFLFLCF